MLALNSYENRVYQVAMEDGPPYVAKFYRPQRWTDAQILEEHGFVHELTGREIPAVAPLALAGGNTLSTFAGFRFAVYPNCGGRAPEPEDRATREGLAGLPRPTPPGAAPARFPERPPPPTPGCGGAP